MKLQKNDVLFYMICLMLVLLFSFLLYTDMHRQYMTDRREQIGTITFKKRIAERSHAGHVIWNTLANNSPVYNYDSIRTEDDSISTRQLDGGIDIALRENTLVVLCMASEKLAINFQGTALNVRKQDAEPDTQQKKHSVTVSSDMAHADITHGELLMRSDADGSINFDMRSGKGVIRSNDDTREISTRNGYTVNDKGVLTARKYAYTITDPPDNKVFITDGQRNQTAVSWEPGDTLKKQIVFSQSPSFDTVAYTKETTGSHTQVSLAPGSYYYKIKSSTGESNTGLCTVLSDSPPILRLPKDDSTAASSSSHRMTHFYWSETAYASSYRLEVFTDDTLDTRLAERSTGKTSIGIKLPVPGIYYWRVTALYEHHFEPDSATSTVHAVTLTQKDGLALPVLHTGDDDVVRISRSALENNTAALQWSEVDGAESYTVEIAEEKNFDSIVFHSDVRSNYTLLSPELPEGDYYWKVTAHADETTSEVSKTEKLIIGGIQSVRLRTPVNNTGLVKQEGDDILFLWDDPNRLGNYLVELSRSETFGDVILAKHTATSRAVVDAPADGKYFWRVHLKNRLDKSLSTTGPESFHLFTMQPPPYLVSPRHRDTLDLLTADDVTFSWNTVPGSSSYDFILYNGIRANHNILYRTRTDNTSVVISDITRFSRQDYRWQVVAYGAPFDELIPISLPAYGHFTVTLSQSVNAPEVDFPEILYEERDTEQ